jgi:hypothetical protein
LSLVVFFVVWKQCRRVNVPFTGSIDNQIDVIVLRQVDHAFTNGVNGHHVLPNVRYQVCVCCCSHFRNILISPFRCIEAPSQNTRRRLVSSGIRTRSPIVSQQPTCGMFCQICVFFWNQRKKILIVDFLPKMDERVPIQRRRRVTCVVQSIVYGHGRRGRRVAPVRAHATQRLRVTISVAAKNAFW